MTKRKSDDAWCMMRRRMVRRGTEAVRVSTLEVGDTHGDVFALMRDALKRLEQAPRVE